jgi:hypothetical protein
MKDSLHASIDHCNGLLKGLKLATDSSMSTWGGTRYL